MKVKEIPVNIFDVIVSVYICNSTDNLKHDFLENQLNNIDGSNFMGLCFNALHKDGKNRRVIWLRKFNLTVLAHELYHTVKYIFDYACVDDHETGAFLMEYLFSESLKLNEE